MGELVKESPQDSEITELQVPRLVQLPGTADRPALSLSFRLAGVQPQRATAAPPGVNSGVTGSTTLYCWLSGCAGEGSFLKSQPLSDVKLFN